MRFKGFNRREPNEPAEPFEPYERPLWSGRPLRPVRRLRGERYFLTDLRLVRTDGRTFSEIALHDIGDVHRDQSRFDRLIGTSTITVESRRPTSPAVVLTGVRAGAQLAALLELLSGE